MNNVKRTATAEKLFQILPIATGTLALLAWVTSGRAGWTIPAVIVAVLITRALLRGPNSAMGWVRIVIGYLVLCFGGLTAMDGSNNPGFLIFSQMLWGISFLASLIALPIIGSAYSRAYAKDRAVQNAENMAAQRAREEQEKRDRIAEKRRKELEHSTRIERQRKWSDRASGAGTITGFEPQDLEHLELRPQTHMYGSPGAGLAGSGFAESNIKLGQQGEINFAKALQKQGLLETFATFWSVHMPDSDIGASTDFNTDIDCVLVSSNSVWLIDVKNYVQGDVTWQRQTGTSDTTGREIQQLIAVDNKTEGFVGQPRHMSRNMQLATDRFKKRFDESGLQFTVKPVVVMMPRRNGIGIIDGVTWPDRIPAAALQHFMQWLADEKPFSPEQEDAQLVSGILQSLLKDDSGSALQIGERPAKSARAASKQPAPASAQTSERSVTTTIGTPESAAEQTKSCASCNGAIEGDWVFCYSCGASF